MILFVPETEYQALGPETRQALRQLHAQIVTKPEQIRRFEADRQHEMTAEQFKALSCIAAKEAP